MALPYSDFSGGAQKLREAELGEVAGGYRSLQNYSFISNTFGDMFAHVITFNTFRRLTALDALQRLGVSVEGFGCPMEYETSVAPWRAENAGEK